MIEQGHIHVCIIQDQSFDGLSLNVHCFETVPGENLSVSIWSLPACMEAMCCPVEALRTMKRPTVVPATTSSPRGSVATDKHGFCNTKVRDILLKIIYQAD